MLPSALGSAKEEHAPDGVPLGALRGFGAEKALLSAGGVPSEAGSYRSMGSRRSTVALSPADILNMPDKELVDQFDRALGMLSYIHAICDRRGLDPPTQRGRHRLVDKGSLALMERAHKKAEGKKRKRKEKKREKKRAKKQKKRAKKGKYDTSSSSSSTSSATSSS